MISPAKVGKAVRESFMITDFDIKAWASCLRDTHPLYHNPYAARSYGYADVLMPPTFPMYLWNRIVKPWDQISNRIILEKQDFRFGSPITAGMMTDVSITLSSVEEVSLFSGTFQRVTETLRMTTKNRIRLEANTVTLRPLDERRQQNNKSRTYRQRIERDAVPLVFSKPWITEYAQCSGDDQPVHTDRKAAEGAGYPAEIVQGMLIMGASACCMHERLEQKGYIQRYWHRFLSPLTAGETLYVQASSSGSITSRTLDGKPVARGGFQ
ncbi:MaoC family dehydratase [Salibacterium qingdaonense]|uniref:N-terminal half of MaoC dehydratase n=1 Tax=Salibacterium qingdaonense TaxID=266892 RepID=A0A1I4IQB1_9BACI|nr:MaoC family dehydratase [Salibacterium qingdaonense]SFL56475.1 N-terminal half of MaoC dehydratase [Salibacterium qingdaonense]